METAPTSATRNHVEWVRTLELLSRWLPQAPARILDVGGASGRYAPWLSDLGYDVVSADRAPHDHSTDAVLVLGRLCHLPDRLERELFLSEVVSSALPGGRVVVTAMSRWAKPLVFAARGQLGEPGIRSHLLRMLEYGHDALGDALDRGSFRHDPSDLFDEMVRAGLKDVEIFGVEGPLGAVAREDPSVGDLAVDAARLAELRAPHLSIHLLAVGTA